MQQVIQRLVCDESGTSSVEYGLIALIIAMGVLAGATGIDNALGNIFNNVTNGFA